MRRWVISDTHFYHDNIAKYCNRPASHTELMASYLAQMIRREDVLYHLGDVHFGTEGQLKAILSQVPGRKYLVRGNHDRWSDTKYMLCGFDGVFDALVVGNAFLTHIPTLPPEGMVNVHGHLHNLGYSGEPAFGEGYEKMNDNKHVLYAPELECYRPVLLEKLTARAKGVKEDAANQIHLPRRKRVPDDRMPQWLPDSGPIRSGPVPVNPDLESGGGTKGVDWYAVYDSAARRH